MRQPCSSTKLSKPPDVDSHNKNGAAARSCRQHSYQGFLLLALVLGLLPSTLGAHVHASRQMRDHIQQVSTVAGTCLVPVM